MRIVEYKRVQKQAITNSLHYLVLSQYYPRLDTGSLQGINSSLRVLKARHGVNPAAEDTWYFIH